MCDAEKEKNLFNSIALKYGNLDFFLSSLYARKHQLIFALKPFLDGEKKFNFILDVGCGVAAPAKHLDGYYENYIGIDNSEKILKLAGKFYGNNKTQFFCGDIKKILSEKINELSVDLILCVGSLHHFEDINGTFALFRKVAKKGGYFVAIEPHNHNMFVNFLRWTRKKIDSSYSKDQKSFSKEEISKLLSENGIKDIEILPQGYFSVIFSSVGLFSGKIGLFFSKIAVAMDRFIEKIFTKGVLFLSWNFVIRGRF